MTAPCGEAAEGECHAPLRQVTYQRAGAGKRPATLAFNPAVMPPGGLRAWLQERLGPLARFELGPDGPPDSPPTPPARPGRPLEPAEGASAAAAPAANGPAGAQAVPGSPVGPSGGPNPPDAAAAASAPSTAPHSAAIVRPLGPVDARRLAALVQRLEETRPKRTHGVRELDRQVCQAAAQAAAALPRLEWSAWRAAIGTAAAGWPPRPAAPPPTGAAHP